MRALPTILIGLSLVASGCFLLAGNLYRTNLKVILINDRPAYYDMDKDAAPGDQVGTLDKRAGDTITTLGIYSGGVWTYSYYLTAVEGKERYILRKTVLTPDDQLYRRLGSKFTLGLTENELIWERAKEYVKKHPSSLIEIANASLIKTKSTTDTSTISYLITRVMQGSQIEYEIICKSMLNGFDSTYEAGQMAFYMVTGRIYKYED